MFNWIKALLLRRSLKRNWADAEREREREREREVCARWTEQMQRERERCVRVLGEQDLALAQQYRWFSETRFGRFFEGKKVAKGVCNVAKLATLCVSISPTTGWATGQTENTRCVNRALKKCVPLEWICVINFDSTNIYIYIYIWRLIIFTPELNVVKSYHYALLKNILKQISSLGTFLDFFYCCIFVLTHWLL